MLRPTGAQQPSRAMPKDPEPARDDPRGHITLPKQFEIIEDAIDRVPIASPPAGLSVSPKIEARDGQLPLGEFVGEVFIAAAVLTESMHDQQRRRALRWFPDSLPGHAPPPVPFRGDDTSVSPPCQRPPA